MVNTGETFPLSAHLAYFITIVVSLPASAVLYIFPSHMGRDSVHALCPMSNFTTAEMGIFIFSIGLMSINLYAYGGHRAQLWHLRVMAALYFGVGFDHVLAMSLPQLDLALPSDHHISEAITLVSLGALNTFASFRMKSRLKAPLELLAPSEGELRRRTARLIKAISNEQTEHR